MARVDELTIQEDLVVAVLAVNRWSLERSFALLDGLRAEGLVDFNILVALPPAEVQLRLVRAGYGRGEYLVSLLAARLQSVAQGLPVERLNKLIECERMGQIKSVDAILLSLNGIGPTVLTNYKRLRSLVGN